MTKEKPNFSIKNVPALLTKLTPQTHRKQAAYVKFDTKQAVNIADAEKVVNAYLDSIYSEGFIIENESYLCTDWRSVCVFFNEY